MICAVEDGPTVDVGSSVDVVFSDDDDDFVDEDDDFVVNVVFFRVGRSESRGSSQGPYTNLLARPLASSSDALKTVAASDAVTPSVEVVATTSRSARAVTVVLEAAEASRENVFTAAVVVGSRVIVTPWSASSIFETRPSSEEIILASAVVSLAA